jgi:subtilisin family serine protease
MSRIIFVFTFLVLGTASVAAISPAMRKLFQLPSLPLKLGAPSHIVILKDGIVNPSAAINRLITLAGVSSVKHRYESEILYGFSATLSTLQVTTLNGDLDIDFVGLNVAMRMDQGLAENRVGLAVGETVPINVKRIGATDGTSVYKPASVGIAILDTGVDSSHPDLNVVDAKNCVTPGASADDDNGHGTSVAGVVAAKNDGNGTIGVAPGSWLVSVKVIDSTGYVDFANAICGIDWIGKWPSFVIKVATMSFGGAGTDDNNCGATNLDALHAAICKASDKGITFVASAGNEATTFTSKVPASYSEVLTVTGIVDTDGIPGATGPLPGCYIGEFDDRAATTVSNFALEESDKAHTIAAPSLCIATTARGGGTNSVSGTSIAVPHVAGTVAICWGSWNGGFSFTAGPCSGHSSAWVRNKIIADAKTYHDADHSKGFTGDPNHPLTGAPIGSHYGYLVWAGGF